MPRAAERAISADLRSSVSSAVYCSGILEKPMSAKITLLIGDITQLGVDAIVNAANSSLLGGGGVDGAIHRAAGAGLLAECQTLGGCLPGQAKITNGYRLPAKRVIHTVGPNWQGGGRGEDVLLASCYRTSLRLAVQHGLRTVAFPAISTGAYGFPMARAARIAVREVRNFVSQDETLAEVILVCFDPRGYDHYQEALSEAEGRK
jgi:O-acetyl-ADP-ribose deacetylase (regulator of RNase III)